MIFGRPGAMSTEKFISPIKTNSDLCSLSWSEQMKLESKSDDEKDKELNTSQSASFKIEKDTENEDFPTKLGNGVQIKEENVSPKREISLDFIDAQNGEKFDRLVKEEKIQTPFKRRHSSTHSNNGSRSTSPNIFDKYGSRKKTKYEDQSRGSSPTSSSSSSSRRRKDFEEDPYVLSRRQKQIDYGKNTEAYDRYIRMVPKEERTSEHPQTPDKYRKYSRRGFDGLVKIWRKKLHFWDPPESKLKDSDSD